MRLNMLGNPNFLLIPIDRCIDLQISPALSFRFRKDEKPRVPWLQIKLQSWHQRYIVHHLINKTYPDKSYENREQSSTT